MLSEQTQFNHAHIATARRFKSYNHFRSLGVWEGQDEPTLTLNIATDEPNLIIELCRELNTLLNQDCIAHVVDGVMEFISVRL
jgi:hypothetical protein